MSKSSTFASPSAGLLLLLPLRQVRQVRRIKNESLHRIIAITCEYRSPVFCEILSARCLCRQSASGSAPPFTEKTNGVKVPCSMFMIRSLYARFFTFSWFLSTCSSVRWHWEALFVFVTHTSKKAFCAFLHALFARISGLASSDKNWVHSEHFENA